jgi:hypothetical protein
MPMVSLEQNDLLTRTGPDTPAPRSFVSKRFQECNWLQAMEGGIDSSQVDEATKRKTAASTCFTTFMLREPDCG